MVNQDLGYVHRIEDFHFLPGVLEACNQLVELGHRIVIITNQAGIARGYYTTADLETLHNWMSEQFRKAGAALSGIYFCPHHPEGTVHQYKLLCNCRKPAPGMILRAKHELNINLADSILVGDKPSDIQAGRRAGINRCYLLTTKSAQPEAKLADGTATDLPELITHLTGSQ